MTGHSNGNSGPPAPSSSSGAGAGEPSGEHPEPPAEPRSRARGRAADQAGSDGRSRSSRSGTGPPLPARPGRSPDGGLAPVQPGEAEDAAQPAAPRDKPPSILSAEAIDDEIEKLKASSKVRKRQLKELRTAGALLGDVLARGFLSAYLLHLCNERPRHGNEILQEIEVRTDGLWNPSSGGIYTVLRKLEKRGLLEGSWQAGVTRERRVYRVTDQGRDALEEFRQLAPPRIAAASRVLEIVATDLLAEYPPSHRS